MNRSATAAVLLLALLSFSCGEESETVVLPTFPLEKTIADFPGVTYPLLEGGIPGPASLDGPVWLLGVDGLTWDLLDPMIERGELPNFARLKDQGAYGKLLSEEPTISPALWATIATGMPRFEHGLVNFMVKLPGSYSTVQAGPPDRRSPAVWELVGAAGGRSLVVSWFGSYPAEEIPGVYVSKGFDPENPHAGQVHPESWMEILKEETRVSVGRQDVEQIARNDFLQNTLVEDARSLGVFRAVTAREAFEFSALYLSGTDVVQHITWRHMDPASQQFPQDGQPDPSLADIIPAYYRFVDNALGELISLAPEGSTLVVVSDHGGGPIQPTEAYHFQLEVLLRELGLMNDGKGKAFAISELYRHEKRIWLNLEGVEANGTVPVADAGKEASAIAERLAALRTDDDSAVFASLVDHTATAAWEPGDPALTVRFSSEALVTESIVDGDRTFSFSPVRLRHTDISGAHRLEGIVMMHGPSVRPGPIPRRATIYNIAPTLLYLLGLPQDGRMLRLAPADGGVLVEALHPGTTERLPIVRVDAYPGTDRGGKLRSADTQQAEDPAARESMERLRALGYVR